MKILLEIDGWRKMIEVPKEIEEQVVHAGFIKIPRIALPMFSKIYSEDSFWRGGKMEVLVFFHERGIVYKAR